MANRGVRYTISSGFDNKGAKAAERSLQTLGKSLGKTIAGYGTAALSVQRLNRFIQESVRLSLDDARAQANLNKVLENSGFGAASNSIRDYITQAQLATGVSEDQLRPAFVTLFNSLGSVTRAQNALNVAMDVSAATGKDLASVTAAIAKTATGSKTSLQRLGLGIDKAKLAAASFDQVLTILSNKFSGSAKVAAETMAGKVDRLKIAVSEAKEEVGKGLVDAFDILAKQAGSDVDSLQTKIQNLGTSTGDMTRGVAVLISKWKEAASQVGPLSGLLSPQADVPVVPGPFDVLVGGLQKLGAEYRKTNELIGRGGSYFTYKATKDAEAAADRQRRKKEAADKAAAAKAAAALRADKAQKAKQAALDKATAENRMKYDLELIGLAAASAKIQDESTKKRLADLAAIRVETYATDLGLTTMEQILKLVNEQFGIAAGKLKELKTAQEGWTAATALTAAETSRLQILYNTLSPGSAAAFRIGETLANAGVSSPSAAPTRVDGQGSWTVPSPGGNPNINVTIQGSLVAQQDLEAAIAGAVNSSARAGVAYSQIFSRL